MQETLFSQDFAQNRLNVAFDNPFFRAILKHYEHPDNPFLHENRVDFPIIRKS